MLVVGFGPPQPQCAGAALVVLLHRRSSRVSSGTGRSARRRVTLLSPLRLSAHPAAVQHQSVGPSLSSQPSQVLMMLVIFKALDILLVLNHWLGGFWLLLARVVNADTSKRDTSTTNWLLQYSTARPPARVHRSVEAAIYRCFIGAAL